TRPPGFRTKRRGRCKPALLFCHPLRVPRRRTREGEMKRLLVVAAVAATAAFAAGAWSAPSSAPTPVEAKLLRDVATLKKQVKTRQASVKKLNKNETANALGIAAIALLADCDAAVTADGFQGTWQVIDQLSAATQAGKTYFGAQTPLSDSVSGIGAACQTIRVTRSQVVPPVITPFDSILALFRTGALKYSRAGSGSGKRGGRLVGRPLRVLRVGEVGLIPYRQSRWPLDSPGRVNLLEPVALFLPVVRVVVVAIALPEARLVGGAELERAEPFRALPEVPTRHDQAERPALLWRERLPVPL